MITKIGNKILLKRITFCKKRISWAVNTYSFWLKCFGKKSWMVFDTDEDDDEEEENEWNFIRNQAERERILFRKWGKITQRNVVMRILIKAKAREARRLILEGLDKTMTTYKLSAVPIIIISIRNNKKWVQ